MTNYIYLLIFLFLTLGFSSNAKFTADSIISSNFESGYYSESFSLELNTKETNLQIIYTIDGSEPTLNNGTQSTGNSASIHIDPSITDGRPKTPIFIVRAVPYNGASLVGPVKTLNFIFLDAVKTQKYPGGSWPSSNVNKQVMDYEIDPDIVNSIEYTELIDSAFKSLPAISVVTDNKNLFDKNTGIYVNAYDAHGIEWERKCNVQLLDFNGIQGFSIDAGLRIRGGASRRHQFPKHSFRLFFREEYGAGKLKYPLFEDEGVDEFDKIDLRTAQNYGWHFSWEQEDGNHNTFLRDIFSRDTQGEMGQPYTRSRYYQLYLNGMYWGIYQTQERAEAKFATSYLGGDDEDYDVVKVAREEDMTIEVTDGNMENWKRIFYKTKNGFSKNENYYDLQGRDQNGQQIKHQANFVEIDNLIDYMMIVFYTGNFDSPVTAWGGNKKPNNFYAIDSRENLMEGFRFFVHDAEHSLFDINENRVHLPDMFVSELERFHPQWLHHKLTANPEYRTQFADRAYTYLTNNGILTPESCKERMQKRRDKIETAIIAESARWGDSHSNKPRTKNDHWLPEVNYIMNEYFPARTEVVINQLKEQGLFPEIERPSVNTAETISHNSIFSFSDQIQFSIRVGEDDASLYYTLNGEDPRAIGGSISPTAVQAANQQEIELSHSASLNVRAKKGDQWSALFTCTFEKTNQDLSPVIISEIHYSPLGVDTISGKKFEFLELKNTGNHPVYIGESKFESAIKFTFPKDETIQPGEFKVIASKPNHFFQRYGLTPSGNYSGNLSNGGELIDFKSKNGVSIQTVNYGVVAPWSTLPLEEGFSLVPLAYNTSDNENNADYWRSSWYVDGSPFADDVEKEITDRNELSSNEFSVYPNPCVSTLKISTSFFSEDYFVEIYSYSGNLVYHAYNSQAINFQELNTPKGLYIVRISQQGIVSNHKIVYQ